MQVCPALKQYSSPDWSSSAAGERITEAYEARRLEWYINATTGSDYIRVTMSQTRVVASLTVNNS